MFWTPQDQCPNDPFENESQLESAIAEVSATLFGPNRIYLDVKKLIGGKGKAKDIPDGHGLKPEEIKIVEAAATAH